MAAFDEIASRLDYPMYVVTAYDGTTRAGCLVGFTTQVSIDPARFLVCLSDKNHTHDVALRSPVLAVHVLRPGQRDVAELFGSTCGADADKFARVAWHEGPEGVPVLDDCLGWFAGRALDPAAWGDHTGLLLEPFAGSVAGDGRPLRFSEVRDLAPGHGA